LVVPDRARRPRGSAERRGAAGRERLGDGPAPTRQAGVMTHASNHTFRATGITTYLKNGATLDKAATIANHASTGATQLYDRRLDEVNMDEVERIAI
jgi:integrase